MGIAYTCGARIKIGRNKYRKCRARVSAAGERCRSHKETTNGHR